jgi:ankyrin repeat protein
MIIRGLIKVAQSGTCTLGQLNESLQRIPNSLNDLYCDIVSKITDSPFKDERLSHYIFSWSCFAGRTLRVNEMRDVAAMFYWKPHSCQAFEVFLETNRVGALTKSWDPLRTLLLNLCGGLIEIVSSGSEPLSNALDSFSQKRRLSPYDEVQLIHTTAKEFLLDSKSPFLDLDKSKSLALISDTCIEYLTMSFLQNEPPILEQHETLSGNSAGPLIDLMDDRPMLAYALEWLPAHLQDEGWEQSSRVAACSKLIAFFQLTEFKIESSPIWDILGLWFFFNFITNDRIGTIPGVEDLRAGFSSKILNIASAQALFREIPPRVPSLVIPLFGIRYYKDDSNDRPNYPFTDSPGDQRLLSSYNFLNASLDYACKEGSLDQVLIILDLCLNAGIDRDNGDTPLCRAVKGGHYLVVRLLIERGADVNKSGPMGDTPLCITALEGHHLVAQLLIEGGADVNKSGPMGDTPLCIAAFEGYHLVVRLLMERGANVNWSRGPTAHSCAGGDTPLNYAVLKGHTRVVKEILKVPGVDYAAPNCDLLTPLTTAFLLGKDHPIRTLLRDYAAVNPSKESTWGWLS